VTGAPTAATLAAAGGWTTNTYFLTEPVVAVVLVALPVELPVAVAASFGAAPRTATPVKNVAEPATHARARTCSLDQRAFLFVALMGELVFALFISLLYSVSSGQFLLVSCLASAIAGLAA
jgi:hypothetical protein